MILVHNKYMIPFQKMEKGTAQLEMYNHQKHILRMALVPLIFLGVFWCLLDVSRCLLAVSHGS